METQPSTATIKSLLRERWAIIPGFDGRYSVSTLGRVKSHCKYRKEFLLTTYLTDARYVKVNLWANGKQKACLVHRLVMLAFVGDCPAGMEVNHINFDHLDNQLSNLEYVTRKQNIEHSIRHRNVPGKSRLLSRDELLEIKALIAIGCRVEIIATKFEVKPHIVHRVRSGRITIPPAA